MQLKDNEDENKRNRNEIAKLQRDIEDRSRVNEDNIQEMNVKLLKINYLSHSCNIFIGMETQI